MYDPHNCFFMSAIEFHKHIQSLYYTPPKQPQRIVESLERRQNSLATSKARDLALVASIEKNQNEFVSFNKKLSYPSKSVGQRCLPDLLVL